MELGWLFRREIARFRPLKILSTEVAELRGLNAG